MIVVGAPMARVHLRLSGKHSAARRLSRRLLHVAPPAGLQRAGARGGIPASAEALCDAFGRVEAARQAAGASP